MNAKSISAIDAQPTVAPPHLQPSPISPRGTAPSTAPADQIGTGGEPIKRAPDSPEWNEAFLRVQSYLHAHHIDGALLLNRLSTEIVEEAHLLAISQSAEAPVTLAMQVMHRRMADWFRSAIEEGNCKEERFRARGRLALLLSNVPSAWPQQFLSAEPLPSEVASALNVSVLQPGPEVRLSKMAPAELEFGFDDSDETPAVAKWAFQPAIGVCVAIAGAMGAAWAATH
jgi:hypothetical protein